MLELCRQFCLSRFNLLFSPFSVRTKYTISHSLAIAISFREGWSTRVKTATAALSEAKTCTVHREMLTEGTLVSSFPPTLFRRRNPFLPFRHTVLFEHQAAPFLFFFFFSWYSYAFYLQIKAHVLVLLLKPLLIFYPGPRFLQCCIAQELLMPLKSYVARG